jgi:predicted PurR-regulated permease PerM
MNELVLTRALYRGGLFVIAIVALVLVGVQLKWVLVQVFAAAIVAAGMAPVVRGLTDLERTRGWRWRPPAALIVLVIYLVVGLLVVILTTILLRVIVTQGTLLAQRAPDYAAKVQEWYASAVARWSALQELDLWDMFGGTTALTQWLLGANGQVLNVAGLLLALFGGALNVIFVLFMALYLTVDGPSMRDYLLDFLPANRRERARRIIANISWRLGQWVVGQLIVCAIVGVGAALALALIGVPGAALQGLVWAVCVLIPGIGPFISAAPTILLGFAVGPGTGVVATVFAVVWSQLENNVIIPRVMDRAVKLNPLVVLVAVLVGYELLGLAGALFAIPIAAALAVVVDELHQQRLLDEAASDGAGAVSGDGSIAQAAGSTAPRP